MFPDFVELIASLNAHKVRYLIVGGYAVAFHARPKATKDVDVLIEPTLSNARRAREAIVAFLRSPAPEITIEKLTSKRTVLVLVLGAWPRRPNEYNRHWMVADWDGSVLVVASSDLLARTKVVRVGGQVSLPVRVLNEAGASAWPLLVDRAGYVGFYKSGPTDVLVKRTASLGSLATGWAVLAEVL